MRVRAQPPHQSLSSTCVVTRLVILCVALISGWSCRLVFRALISFNWLDNMQQLSNTPNSGNQTNSHTHTIRTLLCQVFTIRVGSFAMRARWRAIRQRCRKQSMLLVLRSIVARFMYVLVWSCIPMWLFDVFSITMDRFSSLSTSTIIGMWPATTHITIIWLHLNALRVFGDLMMPPYKSSMCT